MAQASAIQTYNSTTLHEDLTDILTNVSPSETPFLSSFGRGRDAQGVYHEWETDTLAAAADNAHIEGEDYTFSKRSTPTRLGNYTQIFHTKVEVSDTMRAVNPAGYADEFGYQMDKAMKEHARDIEIALVTGTGNAGATGTARRLKGVIPFITSNVSTGTTGTGEESAFNDALQAIWDATGMPGPYTAYMPSAVKRRVSAFTAGTTKQIQADSKQLVNSVEVYESDFGIIKLKKHRYIPAGDVVVLGDDYWKLSYLRPTQREDVAKIGDSTRAVIKSELTLEARAQNTAALVSAM